MAVMLNIIAEKMPKSINLPSLGNEEMFICLKRYLLTQFSTGWLIIFQIFLCAIALICSSVLLAIHKKVLMHRWPVPNWFGHEKTIAILQPIEVQHATIATIDCDGYIDERQIITIKKEIEQSIAKIDQFIDEKQYTADLETKWSEFFMMIDTVLLIAFQLIHVIGMLLILRV